MNPHNIVISGVGLWTPPYQVTNEELVESYNAFADLYNEANQAAIEAGELAAKPHSSAEFSTRSE
jgi:beta-ketodecanoyl-[acyl-carrier-protein] synthase